MDILKTSLITHWLPIATFCPVNNLPDLIFVEMTVQNEFVELYSARRIIRKILSGKTIFMEEVAELVLNAFPQAKSVKVRLMFNKHVVEYKRQ